MTNSDKISIAGIVAAIFILILIILVTIISIYRDISYKQIIEATIIDKYWHTMSGYKIVVDSELLKQYLDVNVSKDEFYDYTVGETVMLYERNTYPYYKIERTHK